MKVSELIECLNMFNKDADVLMFDDKSIPYQIKGVFIGNKDFNHIIIEPCEEQDMKNILSYPIGTLFLGREIKEWISYNLKNKTSHTKQARYLRKYLNVHDDENYMFERGEYVSSASYRKPIFVKI